MELMLNTPVDLTFDNTFATFATTLINTKNAKVAGSVFRRHICD